MNQSVKKSGTNVSFLLAWRFFAGREHSSMISFISTVSVVGLAMAVALLVLVLSVMNGFEKEFRDRILGLAPHATLWFDQPYENWPPLLDQLESEPGVINVQPLIEFKAMAVSGSQVTPLLIQGVDFIRLSSLINPYLHKAIDSMADSQRLSGSKIIVGAELAKKLRLQTGSTFRLMVPNSSAMGDDTLALSTAKIPNIATYSFTVADLLSTGTEIDNGIGLVNLAEANRITGRAIGVEGIQLQFSDIFQSRRLARQLAVDYNLAVRLSDWTQSFGNLYTAIQLSRQMVVLLLVTIIAVAVFNVFVTLGMVVRHKQAEIAILRTMGLSRKGVLLSFVYQGLMISTLGCAIGAILGCLAASLAPSAVSAIQLLLGIEFLQTDVYPINYLPSEIRATDVLLICGAALLMSFVATIYPAWRASKIMPAEALRHL